MLKPMLDAIAVVDDEPEYTLRQAMARAMLLAYIELYQEADLAQFQVRRVEEYIQSPLMNPDTGAKSRTFQVGGVIDVDLSDAQGEGIMDHKTASEDIEDPGGSYWQQLLVESQLSHYLLLKHLNGERANWAVWDVARKPGIRPRALTKAELKTLETEGTYFGSRSVPGVIQRALDDGRESLELYELRLLAEIRERPGRYFQRRRIFRMDQELAVYAGELWDNGQEFIAARASGRRPRNSGACMNYSRPCMYLPLCAGHDTTDSGNWRQKGQVHAELPVLDNDGRNVLTNSRIRTFQLCRRKELYSYEMAIERNDPDEVETLAFGTLWHKALAAYFTAIKEIQNGNTDTSSPA